MTLWCHKSWSSLALGNALLPDDTKLHNQFGWMANTVPQNTPANIINENIYLKILFIKHLPQANELKITGFSSSIADKNASCWNSFTLQCF